MDLSAWQILAGIATTAIATAGPAWGIAKRARTDIATQIHNVEEGIRKWQADTIESLRKALRDSENERIADGNKCDERIDVLRARYDVLQDKYDKLAEQHSDYRVQFHDLRNELNKYVGTAMPGGRRFTDPTDASEPAIP